VIVGERLAALGHAAQGGVVAAVNMARSDEANAHGISGRRWTVAEPDKPTAFGSGQHGGWGPDETRPFLMRNEAGIAPGTLGHATSLVDIAPSLLAFLGLPRDGLDGVPLVDSTRRAPPS
jgi:hypothetical protein